MIEADVLVCGGGPAGLAAAISAKESGADKVIVVERDKHLGGILNQCVHNGFGLISFDEELTGPEYAARYVHMAYDAGVEFKLDTFVINISPDRCVSLMSAERGLEHVRAKAIVLAMGCRERARGSLSIPGFRPQGIYSAGTAQYLVNIEGYLPGREVVILGSGDIGLIMARRMTLEGAHVSCVAEIMPYSGGLKRNIVQCLDDFDIPLLLSHTVSRIEGRSRVSAVWISEVDDKLKPIPGTEKRYPCDTLLLSVGLIPENELSQSFGVELSRITKGPVVNNLLETSIPGVFACGNVLHVHDLCDYVSQEAALAGRNAAAFASGCTHDTSTMKTIRTHGGVRYCVPQEICPDSLGEELVLRFRVDAVYELIYISLYVDGKRFIHKRESILVPGEIQTLTLKGDILRALAQGSSIKLCLEKD